MKILYVITKSNWGGAQRHVFDLAIAMKEKGFTPIVALGGDGVLRKRLEDAGVKTHAISVLGRDISAGRDAASFKQIFSVIRREKPEVIHVHSPKAAGMGALAGKLLRVRSIVYTVHGFAFNEDRPFYQKISIVVASWLTMLMSDKVIVLSKREHDQAARFPFIKRKLIIISPGIKPPVFMSVDGAKQSIAKSVGMDVAELNKKAVIGTIAELHPNKGISYLIQAMKRVVEEHPQALCVIIGDGDLSASLHMQIKEANLEQQVFLVGYVDQASEYLKGFDIFVLPSLKEGMPYVLLEAGLASLPVVATTVGGIPELIEDMKSGVLILPKNAAELAHALSFVIEHRPLARQYATALREKVLKDFSLEKMILDVERVYVTG